MTTRPRCRFRAIPSAIASLVPLLALACGGGQIFESTSGQLTVTESSPKRVAGTFAYVGVDGGGATTPVSGSFVARCRESCR